MKKIVILAVVGLLSFGLGTAGIYLAMPQLSPGTHDSTRVHLDSIGLLARSLDQLPQLALLPDSTQADSSDSTSTPDIPSGPSPEDVIQALQDSLNEINSLVQLLQSDTTRYIADIGALSRQIDDLNSKRVEAAELTKSLSKLEDDQLGTILSGLDFSTLELIYRQSTSRERTRLLQSMPAEKATRFVRTLVEGPQPEEDASAADAADDKETQDAEG